jgi:hypothetical protein
MINPRQGGDYPLEETHQTQTSPRLAPKIVQLRPATALRDREAAATLSFTWEALERQLHELALSAPQKALVPTLVSATRKQAPFKPSDLVLREVLCIASVLMDETFHPRAEEGEMT